MKLSGSAASISASLERDYPAAVEDARRAYGVISQGKFKKSVEPYQALAIYALASQYNRRHHLLEIGTYYGLTAALIALAAPASHLTTLNPLEWEVEAAKGNLEHFKNITIRCKKSWDYLDIYDGPALDFVFVDGDHKEIRRDLPWWNWLNDGGLMLFHDYSIGQARACPPVYRALNDFREELGRDFDVLVMDEQGIGMAGFYRKESDAL